MGLLALGALTGFFDSNPTSDRTPRKPPPQAVGMRQLTSDEWEQNRGEEAKTARRPDRAPKPQKVEPQEKKRKPEERPKGQVVATAPGNGEEDPESKYLSESSNKVKKETRAKEQTPHYRNPMPQATSPQKPVDGAAVGQSSEAAGNDGEGNDDQPRTAEEQKLALEVPDVNARDEVKLDAPLADGDGPRVENRAESLEIQGNSDRLALVPGNPEGGQEGSLGRPGPRAPMHLMPSLTVLDSVVGGAPNDHLDLEEGDGTFLNTREWKYAGFFNRVKQGIGMTWHPAAELRRRDPTLSMYGGRDRQTVVSVTLNKDGRVREVFVSRSCGLDFLDLEAVRAFERAQPFPNPPPGLLDEDGTVQFTFGFFVQLTSSGPGLNFQRFR